MKHLKRIIAVMLVLALSVCVFAACGKNSGDGQNTGKNADKPLVVGYSPFNSKFSPFFGETAYDMDVAKMTGLDLLTSDRTGAIIYKGIEGETVNYNGTDYTYYGPADLEITEEGGKYHYDFTLRDDIVFSDGEKLTVDDVIFSMYVLCDPTYDGSSTLFAQPIEGLEAYRSGMESRMNLILKNGPDAYVENDNYTEEQYNAFWTAFNEAGLEFVAGIKAYLVDAGYNAETDSVATWAANWGFEVAEDATEEDVWKTIVEKYGYDLSDEGINCEVGASDSISALILAKLGDAAGDYQAGVQTGESAASITGIQKTGDNSLRVTLTEADATAIYQFALTIAPMHYYGDKSQYNYEENKFGFPKGDLSIVRSKTTQPLGAGPYKFVKFENGVVNFEANESYFKGAPKTKYVNFLETQDADKLNGVTTGTIDITDPSYNQDAVKAIKKANGLAEDADEVSGNVITVNSVDNLGYGYIGISADSVNVGGDKASEASKNLRKAFATVLSVYRDVAVDSYYGELAEVINYPISNTSWAAPRPTDADYKVAFSIDVEGNPIYTSEMSVDEKYEAALNAALGFFEAAGYTVENGKVTAAPEGAKTEYEIYIPADGQGDHPSFMILTLASEAFEKIGIKLVVRDLAQSSELWTGLEAGTVPMWCAAWDATVDPDMFQIYHPDGGSNYMYDINDDELTELIMTARKSLDQSYRKTVYKQCLDIIVDWAVEIPVYQRQNAIIFSTERVNIDTVTPDSTTFYGWMSEIENLEMK